MTSSTPLGPALRDNAADSIDCAVCDYVDGTRSDECIECAVGKYVKACGSEQLTDRIAFAVGKYIEATGGGMLVSATSQQQTVRHCFSSRVNEDGINRMCSAATCT